MTTLTSAHARAMLFHWARPPATSLITYIQTLGAAETLDLVLRNSAPPPVQDAIIIPLPDLRAEHASLELHHANLLTSDDREWPHTLRTSTSVTALLTYGRAPLATVAGGTALLGPEYPHLEAVEAAVDLANHLVTRNTPLVLAGIGGISAPVLNHILPLRPRMVGRLVVVVTPDDIAESRGNARRMLIRVRSAGGMIVHHYPDGHEASRDAHAPEVQDDRRATRDRLVGLLADRTVIIDPQHDTPPIVSARAARTVDHAVFAYAAAEPPSRHSALPALLADGTATRLHRWSQLTHTVRSA